RLADAGGVHADAKAVAPLGDRADHAARDAAHACERRTDSERHANAVAGVGGRSVEGPALDAGAVEEGLAHADVVLVAAARDDHRAPRAIDDAAGTVAGAHADDLPVGIDDQLLRRDAVVNRHAARLDSGQHAGVKRLPRLLRGLLRVARAAGDGILVVAAGVGAAHHGVARAIGAGEGGKRGTGGYDRLEARVQRLHEGHVLRRVARPQLRQLVGELALVAFELVRQVVAAEHRHGIGLERLEVAGGIRAVEAAAAHACVGIMRALGLLLQHDNAGARVVGLDGGAAARRAEADDDDIRLVHGGCSGMHVWRSPSGRMNGSRARRLRRYYQRPG